MQTCNERGLELHRLVKELQKLTRCEHIFYTVVMVIVALSAIFYLKG